MAFSFALFSLLFCSLPLPMNAQSPPSAFRTEDSASTSSSQQEQRETSERPHGTFSLDGFAHALRIEKDLQDPSRLLNVFLPPQSFGHFRQFIARVTDISRVEEQRWRDANRTFLASLADSSVINVHGLSPGHKYSVAILGRKEAESTLIREDQVLMDPMPLELGVPGNSSAIVATSTNITMRAQKPERALQDTFRVEYHQLDPLKRFPILDVHDIQEQREVELYLGNLSPGRDYAIAVTSLRDELPSQQWRGIVTTRPLRPVSLSVAEVNASCVQFSWVLPPESGADRFKVAYGMLHGPNSMQKLEMVYPAQQAELCQHIVPGRVFIFAVITEKSRQISEPATISHTVRPLPPRELSVEPDFEKARFRVRVHLPSDAESHTEKCQIWVEPEQGGRAEQTVPAQQRGAQHQCEALFELSPGRRYEISATALSEQAASTRVLRNRAVEPGFDFGAFGLTLKEDDAALRLEWPQSEVARLRIADLWARIVGRDSHLHFAVQPLDSDAAPVQMETGPTEPEPVLVEAVRGGDCYKVLLYTVTASGIVSEQRFEQHIRTAAPQLTLTVGQLGPRSATLQAFLFRPKEKRVPALPLALSPQCQLHVVVADALSGELVLERTLALSDPQHKSPSLEVDGLRPWHKYAANAQVNCGSVSHSPCAPKVHRVPRVEFRTESAHPGPIGNLSARPLNPYSAQLRWLAPEEPNGRIHSYIVQIAPLREQEESDGEHQQHSSGSGDSYRPWTESVPAAGAELAADGSESVLPRAEVDKVLDGLAGGRRYRVQVWAVNEAGQADSSGGAVELRTPIAAPPRPAHSVEVLPESMHGHSLRVRFDTDQLSERNGRLTQMALIVAEAGESGGLDEEGEEEGAAEEGQLTNGTQMPTWAMARRVPGRWPPFVALQETLEGRRFGRKAVWTESVGTAQDCEQRSAAQLCNGPLKAGAVYRLKLRLFTAPHLWTDSPLSEPVHMEPPSSDAQFGVLLVALFLLLIAALAVTAAAVFVCWRRRATHQKRRKHSSLGSKFCPAKFPPRRSHHSADNHSTTTAADSCPSPPPDPRQQQRQRESQWAALKMMMAERAADCLAKLGLDAAAAASHDKADSSTAKMVISSPQQRQGQQHNNVLCGGNSAPCSSLFGAPHHRRSKSLRERTGVDQRLERLQPSGIAPGSRHSTLPWTVIRGPNIQPERNRPIQIGDFIEHVRLMSADSDFRFSEEYEDLRTVGLGQSCIAADMTANRAKNRFTNILPYDHSRVKLKPTDDEDGSDYVNASYIPGFNSRREFIAAQGPLPSTRDHFWRLVWEQQVPAVVALTKCVEKGRDKCHQYWPDNSQRSVLHADIEVTLLTESIEYEEFTIRELRLTNLAEPSQPARTVQHLHYQAWPDFGVPDHPAGIVHFARLFRNKLNPSPANKPTIVHCSAGVGRSGTFIALDRLVQHIESGKPIDVFGTVYEMRLERCHMVQNEVADRHCLFRAVIYVLENFYPFLVSQQQQQAYPNVANRPVSSPNTHLPFGTSISSPIGGGGNYATSPTTMTRDLGGQWATTTKGFANNNNNGAAFPWATSAQQQPYVPPKIEVHHHQNDGFLEDDEGIAESGL